MSGRIPSFNTYLMIRNKRIDPNSLSLKRMILSSVHIFVNLSVDFFDVNFKDSSLFPVYVIIYLYFEVNRSLLQF